MTQSAHTPQLLWQPSEEFMAGTNLRHYMDWLAQTRDLHFGDYHALQQWSAQELGAFWGSLWEYFGIMARQPYAEVLGSRQMPEAQWFTGSTLNYAEHVFRNKTAEFPALLYQSELGPLQSLSWAELERQVASVAQALREQGVGVGDRVAAYMPNIPETLVAFLAAASLGAVWSSCSPDFGTQSALDRFRQIEPKVLFAVDGYRYGGKEISRLSEVGELVAGLPSLGQLVLVPQLDPAVRVAGQAVWSDWLGHDAPLTFTPVPFEHPLWILYSSGTTGLPKGIVHSQGGILLEHLKSLTLQANVKRGDRMFWFTTTGWMMWNLLAGGLLVGATVVLFDGNPNYPTPATLWQLAEDTRLTSFGTSPAFLAGTRKAGIEPGQQFDLSTLQNVGVTGSPLPSDTAEWVYEHVKKDIWLTSSSGGTDVCTGFVGGSALVPVYAGEIQAPYLGVAVKALSDDGQPLDQEVGELVVMQPMPSMPIYFWNDPSGERYRSSYFDTFPGQWRQGDFIRFTERGSCVIQGRSDSTLNRFGVRMGTAEIYRLVESLPEIHESLIIGAELGGGDYYMPLFVVLSPGAVLDDALKDRIRDRIRTGLSARQLPDDIFAVHDIPHTLNGKKLEVPIKKLYMGVPLEKAANPDATANPAALHDFVALAQAYRQERGLDQPRS